MSGTSFELLATDGGARRGRLTTGRGSIETPAFMPVGTAATVKAMAPDAVAATGAEIILGNTYHLMLRPGTETIEALGGLHRFMNWPGPILTDSGGFQVMSLAKLRTINEDGVVFQSHIDGSRHQLTAEKSVRLQHALGADISMAFDECTPFPATKDEVASSMRLSMHWAERSKAAFEERPGFGLFGINQGGVHGDLRAESADALKAIDFDGYAIGGLAVGEGQEALFEIVEFSTPLFPAGRPRYLMGVGKPDDLVGAVGHGIDMFDCVMPTRSGRTGQAFTRFGSINLRNARHAADPRPLDEDCACPACRNYSRAYLNHLLQAKEILASMLLTWHNLHYYQDLMAAMRRAIAEATFAAFAAAFTDEQAAGDIERI
ncbi:MAG TPA: tRNA guanosine(34) transglycosylase Tgt [Rhodospirillales bacterium]|nr:tRNA guanosine(34) transglycosylase Tgt [Rhodospirillales bacterium]